MLRDGDLGYRPDLVKPDRLFTPHNSNSTLTREVIMSTTVSEPMITWEKLPDDFPLPDDLVDNINQPLLAAALN